MAADRHHVADADDFDGDGSRVIAEIDGGEVAVFRIDGEFHAVANHCVHQAGPLCEGRLKGRVRLADDGWDWTYEGGAYVECPWHTWTFDVRTGEHVAGGAYSVPTYDVVVEDGAVYVVK